MKSEKTFSEFLGLNFPGCTIITGNSSSIRMKTKLGVVVHLWDSDSMKSLRKAYKASQKSGIVVPVKKAPTTLTDLLKKEFGGAFYYIDKRSNHYRLKTSFHVSSSIYNKLKKQLKGVEGLTISLETLPVGRNLTSDRIIIRTTNCPSLTTI